jgi:hypothetical protein
MRWARAAVTFLRECEWVEAEFLWELVEDFCAVVDFFFDVDEDVLSCANDAVPATASRQARMVTRRRLTEITACSLARLLPHSL